MYKWFHRILTTLWRREIECWTERDEVGYEWCVYVLVRSCCFALIRNQYQKVTLPIMGCYDGRSRVRCSWLIYLAWVHTFGINLLVSGKIVVDRCVLVRESWQLLSFCLRWGKWRICVKNSIWVATVWMCELWFDFCYCLFSLFDSSTVCDVSFVYALSKCSVVTFILLDRFDNNDLACCDSFCFLSHLIWLLGL